MLGGLPFPGVGVQQPEGSSQGYSIWGLPQPLGPPAAAPGTSPPMEGAWGGAWGPPVSTRVASVEGQAQVKTSAWGKPLPAAGQPQPHLQASPQAQPVGGVAGLGAGVPVDPLPVRARLDQAPVGRGLPPASPQQSATSSVVASPLSVPSVPSGPLPGVLSMGIGTSGGMNAGKVVAAVALAGSSATSEGRHVVRCKGLPFSATATSVASFFEPLEIVEGGVNLQLNADGVPSGECFVEFESLQALAEALQRNRQVMGHRYVVVQQVGKAEIDQLAAQGKLGKLPSPPPAPAPMAKAPVTAAQKVAAASAANGSAGGARSARPASAASKDRSGQVASGEGAGSAVVVKMRGLPYSATDVEIADFFGGLRITPGGVSIGRDANGRPSGEAHVEFCTESDAQAAMGLNRQRIGSRYIELFRTKQLPSGARGRSGSTNDAAVASGGGADSLRLRGMPFHSTEADVTAFFKGYSIAAGGIKLGPQGGHGHVRFTSVDEARRALVNLNHSYMGNRYIELFWAS